MRGRPLVYAAATVMIAAAIAVVVDIVRPPFEQVILVNDGLTVLRIDDCSLDGELVPPGAFRRPIDVAAALSCPVYVNRDATYVGCLVVRREKQNDRRIDILASVKPRPNNPAVLRRANLAQ